MTREETIKWLESLKAEIGTIKWLESLKAEIGKSEHRTLWYYAEAIDMAITALQSNFDDKDMKAAFNMGYNKGLMENTLKNIKSYDKVLSKYLGEEE